MLNGVNQEERNRVLRERLYEVADVTFGYKKSEEANILIAMDKIDREKGTLAYEAREKSSGGDIPAGVKAKVQKLQAEYDEL